MRPSAALRITHRHALALLLVLAGCAAPAKPPVLAAFPAPVDGAGGTAAPRINGSVGTTRSPVALVSYGVPPLNNLPPGEAAPTPGGDISLDFADTDIREVVAQILGTMLKANYTIDPAVHGTVDAAHRAAADLAAQLLPTLQTLLAGNGAVLVQPGGLYRVVPATRRRRRRRRERRAASSCRCATPRPSRSPKCCSRSVGTNAPARCRAGQNAADLPAIPSARRR